MQKDLTRNIKCMLEDDHICLPISNTISKKNLSSALPIQNMNSKKQKIDHNISGGCENYDFWQIIPSGFRFHPTEQELITAYLRNKVMNEPLPPNLITEVEVYKYKPEELSRQYRSYGEEEWYFFSPRDRKYQNGKRPNRSTGNGYWKATGKCQSIYSNEGSIIGQWRSLVYYEGNHQRGKKTNWIMREYWLDGINHVRTSSSDMKLDDWVLCKIYQNAKNYMSSFTHEEAPETIDPAKPQLVQPPSQLENDNMVPSKLLIDPNHMNHHSSEISQAPHLPSSEEIQDEMIKLDDVLDLIYLDNLALDNMENYGSFSIWRT